MDIYQKNYRKLLQLIPTLHQIKSYVKLTAPGYMPLNIDIMSTHHKKIVIALSHYYKHPSGDMIADPDMTIAVFVENETIEALTYQDFFGYRKVYDEDFAVFSPTTKKALNSFLGQWLTNLLEQGHTIR